jgi:hypothetical protein
MLAFARARASEFLPVAIVQNLKKLVRFLTHAPPMHMEATV